MDSRKNQGIEHLGVNESFIVPAILKKMLKLKQVLNVEGTLDDAQKAFVAGYLSAGQSQGFIDQKVIRDILEKKWITAMEFETADSAKQSDHDTKASEDGPAVDSNASKPKRAGHPWSEEEKARLIRGFKNGVSIEDLAKRHKRSEIAINYQLEAAGARVSEQSDALMNVAGQSERTPNEYRLATSSSKINTLLSDMNTSIEPPPGRFWKFGGPSWMQQVGHEHDKNLVKNAIVELNREIRGLLLILRESAETEEQRAACSRAKSWISESTENLVMVAKIFAQGKNESDIIARLSKIEKSRVR